MLSSFESKDLNFDWNEEKICQEEDIRLFHEPYSKSSYLNKHNNTTTNNNNKKHINLLKKEINLPKTKLTRTGQLYLYTDEIDDEKEMHENRIKSILNQNIINNSYSKKWIDDVSNDFSLDTYKFLDEKIGESLNKEKSFIDKLGKNTEYFVHGLKVKSGKDRRMQKASYLEYLPEDFDSKNQLADAIKSINSSNNHERAISGRQTVNSAFSQIKDLDECISSDDEKNDELVLIRNESSKPKSRLSSQPVLSAQNLINRLSCTTNTRYLISSKKQKSNMAENLNLNQSNQINKNQDDLNLTINYKETFNFDDINTNKENTADYLDSKIDIISQNEQNINKSRLGDNFHLNERKKILDKRNDKKNTNHSNNLNTSDYYETYNINYSKSSRNNSIVTSKSAKSQNSQNTNLFNWQKHPQSARIKQNLSTETTNLDKLAVIGANTLDNEENLPNLYTRTPNSFNYSSFINNRNPTTPVPPYDKMVITTEHVVKQQVVFKPPNSIEEDLEPITISLTEIENETTGNSIKIRRFFDRKAIRIKKMPINKEQPKSFHNNSNENNILSKIDSIKSNIDINTESIHRNSNLINNIESKLSSRRNSNKSNDIINVDNSSNSDSETIKKIKLIDKDSILLREKPVKSLKDPQESANQIKHLTNIEKPIKNSIELKNKNSAERESRKNSLKANDKNSNIDIIEKVNKLPNSRRGSVAIRKSSISSEKSTKSAKSKRKNSIVSNHSQNKTPNSSRKQSIASSKDKIDLANKTDPIINNEYSQTINNNDDKAEKSLISNQEDNLRNDLSQTIDADFKVNEDQSIEIDLISDEYLKAQNDSSRVLNQDSFENNYSNDSLRNEINEEQIDNEIEEEIYISPVLSSRRNSFESIRNNSSLDKFEKNQENKSPVILVENEEMLQENVLNNESRTSYISVKSEGETENILKIDNDKNNLVNENEISKPNEIAITEHITEKVVNIFPKEEVLNNISLRTSLLEETSIKNPCNSFIDIDELKFDQEETLKNYEILLESNEENLKESNYDINNEPQIQNVTIIDKEESFESENNLKSGPEIQTSHENVNTDVLNLIEDKVNNDSNGLKTSEQENLVSSEESFKLKVIIKNESDGKISSLDINQTVESSLITDKENKSNEILNKQEIKENDKNLITQPLYDNKNNVTDNKKDQIKLSREPSLLEKNEATKNHGKQLPEIEIKPELKLNRKEEHLNLIKKSSDNNIENNVKQPKKVEFSETVLEKIIFDIPTDQSSLNTINHLRENTVKEDTSKEIEKNIVTGTETVNKKKPNKETKPIVSKKNSQESVKIDTKKSKLKASQKSNSESIETKEKELDVKEEQKNNDDSKSNKMKFDFSKFDSLLGIKNDKPEEKPKENIKEKLARVTSSYNKTQKIKQFPHLILPWDSKEPIVDYAAFKRAFQVPEILCPQIHEIDPVSTSIDELILERRILEDKILELRQEKLNILNMKSDEKAKLQNKQEKKKTIKKSSKIDQNKLKDIDLKERVIREERLRLHNEALKKQIERENIRNLMLENINEKNNEIENLKNELEKNTKEFKSQYNSVVEQINYLEETEDQIADALAKGRIEMREKIAKNHAEMRKSLREVNDEKREQKLFDFNVKKKELDWLLGMYSDSEEGNKIRTQQAELQVEIDAWLQKFENECIEEERELDEKEDEDENRLNAMEQEEEENSLKSIKQEQFELLQEKKILVENFEDIKVKITNRIQKINEEREVIEKELKLFDEGSIINIEKQKEKLIEIMQAEHDAKEDIKKDMEQYKESLMNIRKKNLEMRNELSLLNHCHYVTKPFVFSYVVHWPIESFSRPFNTDKKQVAKPKK